MEFPAVLGVFLILTAIAERAPRKPLVLSLVVGPGHRALEPR